MWGLCPLAPPYGARAARPAWGDPEPSKHAPPQNGADPACVGLWPHAKLKDPGVLCPAAYAGVPKARAQDRVAPPANALWPGALSRRLGACALARPHASACDGGPRVDCARQIPVGVAKRGALRGKPAACGLGRNGHSPTHGTPAPHPQKSGALPGRALLALAAAPHGALPARTTPAHVAVACLGHPATGSTYPKCGDLGAA